MGLLLGQVALPSSSTDVQWQTLKAYGRPSSYGITSKSKRAAMFLDQANQLKQFYTQYPNDAHAKEAKWLEALALNQAALNEDTSQETRRLQLLADVRKDVGIPLSKRFEAVAWSNQVAIARRKLMSRAAFLAAQEEATRSLIAEFPTFTVGYESLCGIAQQSEPSRGRIAARDILAMSSAPAAVKTEAQRLLDRYELVGKQISSILAQGGVPALSSSGTAKVRVFYTWSKDSSHSIADAKRLEKNAPQSSFVGICLDTNVAVAKQAASSVGLPGEQYFHELGTDSPLASALKTGKGMVVYLVDRNGAIRDVQGQEDFSRKVAELEK
jgi:hypothetical protein